MECSLLSLLVDLSGSFLFEDPHVSSLFQPLLVSSWGGMHPHFLHKISIRDYIEDLYLLVFRILQQQYKKLEVSCNEYFKTYYINGYTTCYSLIRLCSLCFCHCLNITLPLLKQAEVLRDPTTLKRLHIGTLLQHAFTYKLHVPWQFLQSHSVWAEP